MHQEQTDLLIQILDQIRSEIYPGAPENIGELTLNSGSDMGQQKSALGDVMGDPSMMVDVEAWQTVMFIVQVVMLKRPSRSTIKQKFVEAIEEVKHKIPNVMSKVPRQVIQRVEVIVERNIGTEPG